MKNKWRNYFLTGTILVSMLGGMVSASDFSDGTGNVETVSEFLEMEDSEMEEEISGMEASEIEEELPGLEDFEMSEEFSGIEALEGTEEFPNMEASEGAEEFPETEASEVTVENSLMNDFEAEAEFQETENDKEIDSEIEETDFAIFTSENAELLTAFDDDSEEMIEALESGEILAVAPVDFAEIQNAETIALTIEEETALTAVSDSAYTIISTGPLYCDEVWSEANAAYPSPDSGYSYVHPKYRQCTVNRTIQYVDANGNVKKSPLYCLNATKGGVNPGSGGQAIKEEAISLITNSTMKKILYFGHGGPGDICDQYDPTCKHIDWTASRNRYVFTHLALSITYSKDAGYATDEEVEHVGLNKFIAYMKSLTIPNRKAVKLWTKDSTGNIVSSSNLNVDLSLYSFAPEEPINGLSKDYSNGYQISPLIHVKDEGNAGNGIRLYSYESDTWQILYWKTEEEYSSTRGENKPRILGAGKNVLLKDGACFRIVFPEEYSKSTSFSYEMSLYPVSYLLINGNTQVGENGFQNMGAYVYQDVKGSVKLTVNPAPMGDVKIIKTSDYDEALLKGAEFTLIAAQDLYSGDCLIYKNGTELAVGKTDKQGVLLFENLIPGKYKVKETGVLDGYVKNTKTYSKTVKDGKTVTADISNIPNLKGYVEIEKVVEGTKVHLSDAKFSIYSWKESEKDYSGKVYKMTYDSTTKKYRSPTLSYTEENKGKFRIVETQNPKGYTGSWSKKIRLADKTETQKFSYTVENKLAEVKRLEIQKICAETGKVLKDAVFTLYEYSKSLGAYKTAGTNLVYDEELLKYVSGDLKITDDNTGRFKVVETKTPEGYTGEWQKEINLMDGAQEYQFTVENKPVVYPKGQILVKKTDSLTGEILNDAEFTIYTWDESEKGYLENPFDCVLMNYEAEQERYVSGELEITPQNQGKFKIVETKNPEGYSGTWEKEVVLSEEILEISLDAENQPERLPLGEITIVKKIKEKDIVWAHGNPTFHFVVEGVDLYGKYHRYENYVRYLAGSYSLDENGYAVMKCVFSKVPFGNYQIYERPVSRYYLKDAYADTTNVSVVRGTAPAYGVAPKEIAYGNAELNVKTPAAAITFINEKQRYDDYSHNSVVKNVISAAGIAEE